MIKRLLSYLFPITIFEKKSSISENLEVTWNNGKLVLDSKNTNYSYGSLQKVLRKGLSYIGFDKISTMNEILVLGVAGGSVVKTLVDEIKCKAYIIGVEIDESVIEISNTYFGLDKIPNYKTVIADASQFVSKTTRTYDLIIIDIFQDSKMPDFLFSQEFINAIKKIVTKNGFILFNTMLLDETNETRNVDFMKHFEKDIYICKTFSNVEYYNQLIIIEKNKID
ncbi:spermidine synthase [Flavobacterium sp.]|uniref:spermidine synthase n=1 Tax=Flavobacterium sp. TaxID=239 RepID=UPI004048B433